MTSFANIGIDRPIKKAEDDRLYYKELYAEKLHSIIEENANRTIKIGLFAKFGTGKTSTINLLWERLRKKKNNCNNYTKNQFIFRRNFIY